MAVVSLLVFVFLLANVISKAGFFGIDQGVNSWVVSMQSAWITQAAIPLGLATDPYLIVAVMLAAAIYLWFKGAKKDSLTIVFIVLVVGGAILLFKFLVQRDRPLNMIADEAGYSFPSGHATMAVTLFGSSIYLTWTRKISKLTKSVVVVISIFMTLLIGLDRLYLNVHWLSDVIGGYALGTFLVGGTAFLRAFMEAATSSVLPAPQQHQGDEHRANQRQHLESGGIVQGRLHACRARAAPVH